MANAQPYSITRIAPGQFTVIGHGKNSGNSVQIRFALRPGKSIGSNASYRTSETGEWRYCGGSQLATVLKLTGAATKQATGHCLSQLREMARDDMAAVAR